MFRINIITIGKNKDSWVSDAVAHYLKLLQKYAHLELIFVPEIKGTANLSAELIRKREAEILLKAFRSAHRIALCDTGRKYDSLQFATHLEKLKQDRGECDIIIGGAYGLHATVLSQCSEILSLSPMTFSHQLVRVVLLEQLYRALTIMAGHKYHK